MSDSTANLPPSLIRPMAIPATCAFIGTPASISARQPPQTEAIDDEPLDWNGNAFDISYARFSFRKLFVTECDKWYMKEALAEIICQLREEKKCWATYERKQGCFHVVSR